MRFTVLGSGTTLPDADRGPAGFLVQAEGRSILVDGGSGTLQRLKRAGVDARELDGGVYSHRHVDHTGDLVPLLFTLKVGIDRPRTRDYPIWGGQGFQGFLSALLGVYGQWIQGTAWSTVVTELPLDGPGEALLPGGVLLRTLPANHAAGALHLRFEHDGRSVTFSGDTGASPALAELAEATDLLVCECAYDGPEDYDGHLYAELIRDMVAQARPAQVWLTHMYPQVDPERALRVVREAGAPVIRARDGQSVEL